MTLACDADARLRGRTARTIAVTAVLVLSTLALAWPRLYAQDRASIAFEQSLVTKTLADEYFLQNQRDLALTAYRRAASLLDTDVLVDAAHRSSPEVLLLQEELSYRLSLVANPRMDFWGAELADTATDPVSAYGTFRDHLANLETVAKEVQDAIDRLRGAGGKELAIQIEQEKAAASRRLGELKAEAAQISIDYTDRRVGQARERIDQLFALAEEARREQSQKLSNLESAESRVKSAVLSGIGKAAGLPVDLGAVANGGSLQDALVSSASSLASSPEFVKSLSEMSATAGEIAEVYRNAKEVIATAETAKQGAEQLRDLIRRPTFDNLIKVGSAIYDKLPETEKTRLQDAVLKSKPLLPLVQVMQRAEQTRTELSVYLKAKGIVLPQKPDLPSLEKAADEYLRKLSKEAVPSAFDEMLARLSPELRREAMTRLGALSASAATASIPGALSLGLPQEPSAVQVPPRETSASSDQTAAAVQAVIVGGVSAAFPPAALAATAIEVAKSLGEISSLASQINALSERIERLTVEEMHLRDVVDQSLLTQAQAKVEGKMADVRSRSAARQLELWDLAIDNVTADNAADRRKIRYRLSLVFYLCDRLRQDFDRLDRSLGMWTGALENGRGNMRRIMSTSPQWRRLALDRDIHLFEWLDRGGAEEQRRDDVDRVLNHWRRLSTLALDVMQQLQLSPEGGGLGSVAQTSAADGFGLSIRTLVGTSEWSRFAAWQRARTTSPFVFSLVVTPGGLPGSEPIAPLSDGMRVVTVRLGDVSADGAKPLASNVVKLIHPGVGYVPRISRGVDGRDTLDFVSEVLAPIEQTLDAPDPGRDQNDAFRSRWRKPYRLLPFEGYSLYGVWYVVLDPVERNFALRDLRISYVYQYVPRRIPTPSTDYVETLTAKGGDIGVHTRYLSLLTSSNETLAERIERWAADRSGPPWQHTVVTSPTTSGSVRPSSRLRSILRAPGGR